MVITNDVTIIGGGAIGLSIGYYLKQKNIETLIIEKNNHFGGESSLRNTGIAHSGIYYKFGSLKSKLAYIGSKYLYAFATTAVNADITAGRFTVELEYSVY